MVLLIESIYRDLGLFASSILFKLTSKIIDLARPIGLASKPWIMIKKILSKLKFLKLSWSNKTHKHATSDMSMQANVQ